MEGLAVLGVAANIAQFLGYGIKLIATTKEICNSAQGATKEVETVEAIYGKLRHLSSKLRLPSQPPDMTGGRTAAYEQAIQDIAQVCQDDCDRLLEVTKQLKRGHGRPRRYRSFKKALKSMWEGDQVRELEQRLQHTQQTLTLHICSITAIRQSNYSAQLMHLQASHDSLGLRQSLRLTEIQREVHELGDAVQHARSILQDTGLPSTSIASLENQMARLSVAGDELEKEHTIIKTLNFDTRLCRYDGIPEAHEKTFKWVFEKANNLEPKTGTGNLLEWLQHGNGIFWISGKPGSGKSTLMKFVSHDEKTKEALSMWSGKKPLIIATHFFWCAGTPMQKSRQGLLKTLLFDILRQQPDLIEQLCPERWKRRLNQLRFEDWKAPELGLVLQRIAHAKNVTARFCFFIDGLDEYEDEDDHAEFCKTLELLSRSPYVKLCVASRPWNFFEDSFGRVESSKIYIHELTRKDIHEYVEANLTQHPRWNELIQETEQAASLVQRVTKKSSGVFLWVYLATRELRSGMSEYDSYSDLRLRLRRIPADLEALFKKILESVDSFHHQKMAELLQLSLVVLEPAPTSLYYFQDMDCLDKDYALKLPFKGRTDEELLSDHRLITRRLNGRCRGLLEVSPSSSRVEFLHRTVMEYLRTPEMDDFLRRKARPSFNVYLSASRAFVAYIKRTNFVETKKHGGYTECEKPEFMNVLKEVIFHTKGLDESTGYQVTL
ncbi:hypothetical protein PG994_006997 [Apiospora phragmitis]|uniref:NACHT domain-containing protein n=1 Tax=Apiospora phragmitis TaxID=2905665 RepID=A0ABR1UZJ6_9PEZI